MFSPRLTSAGRKNTLTLFISDVIAPIRQMKMQYGMTSGISFSVSSTRGTLANGRSIMETLETIIVMTHRIRLSQIKIVEKRLLAVSCP